MKIHGNTSLDECAKDWHDSCHNHDVTPVMTSYYTLWRLVAVVIKCQWVNDLILNGKLTLFEPFLKCHVTIITVSRQSNAHPPTQALDKFDHMSTSIKICIDNDAGNYSAGMESIPNLAAFHATVHCWAVTSPPSSLAAWERGKE